MIDQFSGLNHNTLMTVSILLFAWSIFQLLNVAQCWKRFTCSEKVLKCISIVATVVIAVTLTILTIARDIAI